MHVCVCVCVLQNAHVYNTAILTREPSAGWMCESVLARRHLHTHPHTSRNMRQLGTPLSYTPLWNSCCFCLTYTVYIYSIYRSITHFEGFSQLYGAFDRSCLHYLVGVAVKFFEKHDTVWSGLSLTRYLLIDTLPILLLYENPNCYSRYWSAQAVLL